MKYWLWDRPMQSCLGVFSTQEEAEDYADKHFIKRWREWVEIREVASTDELKQSRVEP